VIQCPVLPGHFEKEEYADMKNMRVFIVVATFHPLVGGAERQALEQGRSLCQGGLEATVVTFRHKRSWAVHDTVEGVPVIRVAGTLLGGRDKLPRVLQKFLYLIALLVMGWVLWQYRHRYDLLHVYQLNWLALVTALTCYLNRKPMVVVMCSADPGRKDWSQHEVSLSTGPLDVHDPMLHISRDPRVGGDLKDLAKLGKPMIRFTRSLFQRTDTVVIILSTRMREYLAAHDFIPTNVLLIPNGVDTSRFYPVSEDASDSQRSQTVVCIARLSYEKGLDVLLQAWHLVHKELPDARLIVAGKGPLQAQLAYIVKALDIEECVEFLGLQSDVAAVLHRGGIATLPSRWEGMPNAILEAMACGLPCVATRVSGTEDIITHEVNGLLVEPEDYQGMAQALLALLRDPALSSAYGKAALEKIEQDYTLGHITDIYVKLYQRMIGDRKVVRQTRSSESQPPTGPITGAV
jgi:glycosyltransferase involved in cell wall biosynthesis